jgi:hypothetical protein
LHGNLIRRLPREDLRRGLQGPAQTCSVCE